MASPKVFSLENRSLKLDSAADIKPLLENLVKNNEVEEVHFNGNTLGIGASEELAEVLKTKKNLKHVNLADIFTGRLLNEIPQALDALLQALLSLPSLETVNLSDNAFGLNTQAPLVSFLSAHTPLRHLILNNNGLGPAAGILIADALSRLAEKKAAARAEGKSVPNLETVICGRNRLETGSMAAWAKAYAAHTGVKEIRMVQNGIRQSGIALLLTEGLKHVSGIQILDLQDNTFTATGAQALSDVVGGWSDLRELGVGDCLLSAKGGVLLGKALSKGNNQKLEVLRLQYNEIKADGVKSLADAAPGLPVLRRVELNGNIFAEDLEDIERLRESLDAVKEKIGATHAASDNDEAWGLDELDELEEEDSDEEEAEAEADEDEEEEGVEVEEKAAKEVALAQQAEEQNVSQKQDKDVDALADRLSKEHIK